MWIGMNKCECIYIISMIVIVFVLNNQVTPSNAVVTSCSWSLWSPWNCSCCTRYYKIPTQRFRIKCCSNTKECSKLSITATLIATTDDDKETNPNCENRCSRNVIFNSPSCTPTPANFQSDRNLSCQHVCLGPINGDYSSNSPPNYSHNNNTYQGITTLPGGTLKPQTNNNINVEISVQNRPNNGGIIGGVCGGLVVMAICIGIIIWLKKKQICIEPSDGRPSEVARTRFHR